MDDGSICYAAARLAAIPDVRLRYVQEPMLACQPRGLGVRHATGSLISFLDSDDSSVLGQARQRGGGALRVSGRGRGLLGSREAPRGSGVCLVHAPDGGVLSAPAQSAGGPPAARATRATPVPARGGAHQAERTHPAPGRFRRARRIRRDVVVLRGLGAPAEDGPHPSLRLHRPAAGRAAHLGRFAAPHGSDAGRDGDDPAASARAWPATSKRWQRSGAGW